MKKFLKIICIMFFMCFMTQSFSYSYDFHSDSCKDDVVYKYATTNISVINPNNNSVGGGYPGNRGANQLVIYTSDYGNRTHTNEFGTEAIVENGYVISLSGADSIIPKNGFVISGHGRAKEWINKNVALGSKIIVDDTTLTITSYYTADSFLFATREKVKEVLSMMKYYSNEKVMYDYTTAVDYLEKTKKSVRQADSKKKKPEAQKYSSQALDNANKAIMYAMPYYPDELKGVWLRPTKKSEKDIENTLDKLKAAGITDIFLETYFHAKTIYPSEVLKKYGITNQREEFVGSDPLKIWIDEAHKRGMKVHTWFETFYVGNDNPRSNSRHILAVYPSWANVTKKDYDSEYPVASSNEHNGYFLDPSNPEVQNYLLAVLDEIVTKYKPDGVNIDYIRYPQTVDRGHSSYENWNWGYTKYARNEFLNMYDIDPIEIQKNTVEWNLWARYRQDKVTDFVKMAKKTVDNRALVTAVIFPDRRRSLDTKMQDWNRWSRYNYVDGFTPLILSCDYKTSKRLLNDIISNSSSKTKIYAGLFVTFMKGSTDDLLKQIHLSRELGVQGVIIFDYNHFTEEYRNAVSLSAFKPLSDKSIKKIENGEISQQKLKTSLSKLTKEFNSEKAFQDLIDTKPKKQETIDKEQFIKEVNEKFAPENDLGKKGRFF